MRVLHVTHQFAPETRGGVEGYVSDLLVAQEELGHEVFLITGSHTQWPKCGTEEIEVDGRVVYRIHREDLFFDHYAQAWHRGVAHQFATLLERLRPEVVHIHHWIRLTNNLVAIAHRLGIPAVVTLHDVYTSCPRAFRIRSGDSACSRLLSPASCRDCVPRYGFESPAEIDEGIELFGDSYRADLGLAHRVFVAIEATARLLAQTTGMPITRYSCLPMGYRPRFPASSPLRPHPKDSKPLRFAFWGGVGRHKGVAHLLDAFRIVNGTAKGSAELHVLGGIDPVEFEDDLRRAATGLPVTFHGPYDHQQVRAVAPHVGVFPSTCIESYGIVLDECFELGLPCIISDLGALPEHAAGGGLKVPPGDAQALAQAMIRLLREPDLRDRLVHDRPPSPPTMAVHTRELADQYEQVRLEQIGIDQKTARPAVAVPMERRVRFEQMRQASLAEGIIPLGGPS